MNLAAQIRAALSAPKPAPREDWRLKNLRLGAKGQTDKAINLYEGVMKGKGWLTQRQIENALGYAATVSTSFLIKLKDTHKLVERRNRDDAPTYNRMRGYEWRWKE